MGFVEALTHALIAICIFVALDHAWRKYRRRFAC